jgi:hypothetical protein
VKILKSQIILISLFALFLPMNFLIRTSFVRASQGTVVEVLPSEISADVGQSFTINITVANVQNLYGLDVTVDWESSVLQLVKIDVRLGHTDTDGALYNSSLTSSPYIVVNSTLDSQYEIAATSEAPAPSFNGTGNIVRLTFKVIDSGDSSIDFIQSQLSDYPPPDREPRISQPIPHSTIGGQFSTTVPEIPNLALFLGFAFLTASTLALSKKTARRRAHSIVLDDTKQGLLIDEKAYIRECDAR